MKPIDWSNLDWATLDRLRDRFLGRTPGRGPYWESSSDLANYDFTFARRIGWKWDAVLRELRVRGWAPPTGPLLDWGCGSGIASRRVLDFFRPEHFELLRVFDHSSLAMEFAATSAQALFPNLRVERIDAHSTHNPGTVLVSHVLNELDEAGGKALRQVLDRAAAVIWVEPGTHADSRALIAVRESLREQFVFVAPCPHQGACGLLAAGNERHWCHHFAAPPAGIMADANWVRFGQRADIDLRSLPYSFVVMERKGLGEQIPGTGAPGWARVIGEPRIYKGFAKVLSCHAGGAEGVTDLELQKRDAPEVFKAMKSGEGPMLVRGTHDGRRWKSVEETR